MFRARDKSKIHFKEWITKIIDNLGLYMDVIQPRLFSDNAQLMNKPLPIEDICFGFIFDTTTCEDRESA